MHSVRSSCMFLIFSHNSKRSTLIYLSFEDLLPFYTVLKCRRHRECLKLSLSSISAALSCPVWGRNADSFPEQRLEIEPKLSSDLPLRCPYLVEIEFLSVETILHLKWCERKDVMFLTGRKSTCGIPSVVRTCQVILNVL